MCSASRLATKPCHEFPLPPRRRFVRPLLAAFATHSAINIGLAVPGHSRILQLYAHPAVFRRALISLTNQPRPQRTPALSKDGPTSSAEGGRIERRQKCFPLRATQSNCLPVRQRFVGTGKRALQNELAYGLAAAAAALNLVSAFGVNRRSSFSLRGVLDGMIPLSFFSLLWPARRCQDNVRLLLARVQRGAQVADRRSLFADRCSDIWHQIFVLPLSHRPDISAATLVLP
jgi:hypothetical protein